MITFRQKEYSWAEKKAGLSNGFKDALWGAKWGAVLAPGNLTAVALGHPKTALGLTAVGATIGAGIGGYNGYKNGVRDYKYKNDPKYKEALVSIPSWPKKLIDDLDKFIKIEKNKLMNIDNISNAGVYDMYDFMHLPEMEYSEEIDLDSNIITIGYSSGEHENIISFKDTSILWDLKNKKICGSSDFNPFKSNSTIFKPINSPNLMAKYIASNLYGSISNHKYKEVIAWIFGSEKEMAEYGYTKEVVIKYINQYYKSVNLIINWLNKYK